MRSATSHSSTVQRASWLLLLVLSSYLAADVVHIVEGFSASKTTTTSTTSTVRPASTKLQLLVTSSSSSKQLPDYARGCKILILPGFGNDSSDYTFDGSLVSSLMKQGWTTDQIRVLPLERKDWIQVFVNGAFDVEFWKGSADPTRPAFRWYLKRISDQIEQMTACDDDDDSELELDSSNPNSRSKCTGVILIGHSAGGWLGRAAMGFGSTTQLGMDSSSSNKISSSSSNDGDNDLSAGRTSSPSSSSSSSSSSSNLQGPPPVDLSKILGIVSLGAPHLPPPPGVMDMTRGALRLTDERFPGSYHGEEIFYLTTVGLAVTGTKQQRQSPFEPTTITGFAYNSYEAVCGDGTTVGDGVVPQCSAHLDGAVQLNLDGVFHSINVPDNWYGSQSVIEKWHTPMLTLLKRQVQQRQRSTKQTSTQMMIPSFGMLDALSDAVASWRNVRS